MKVTLYGASGIIGSRVLAELLARGHQVTAVARHTEKLKAGNGLALKQGDISDVKAVADTASGADAAISAFGPGTENPGILLDVTRSLIDGLKQAGVKRFIMVGGAGSLEVAPGVKLIDAPNFPAAWKGIAQAHAEALEILRKSDLDWTSFSPAALIEPGQRTGKFRLGKDNLVTDAKGESHISAEDYAIALVDELEKPEHVRARFTAAY